MNKKNIFIIDTPPPTVSGQLHMGHVFSYSHADFIARYQRIIGNEVIFPIGFDDNGLPTERLVEKIKGKKAKDYPNKDDFLKECEFITNDAEKEFQDLFETLGYSYDWNLKYQTISDSSAKIAQWSFKDLYDKELIYQAFKPVYWDIIDQTALANADIEEIEQDGWQYYFNFKLCDKDGNENRVVIEIMTTRPEMLPACLAVMYNPNHANAKNFEGKFAKVPLTDLKVPLIADETICLERGTGAMMVCFYGDWHDVELIEKYNLKIILKTETHISYGSKTKEESSEYLIYHIDADGRIDFNRYDEKFNNWIKTTEDKKDKENFKNPQEAKKFVISYCKENNLFSRATIAKKQMVKVGERSKHPVEIIETLQWYLKIKDFKEDFKLISRHIKFHPEHMRNRLEQWIDSIDRDWCISRDRFMGIAIPYSKDSEEMLKTENMIEVKFGDTYSVIPDYISKYPYSSGQKFTNQDGLSGTIQSKQVFDTWFTSSCTPQIIARYLNCEFDDGKKFNLPFQMRTQSHEIIRTWAFYTIVKSYLHGLSKTEIYERKNFHSSKEWFKNKNFFDFENVKNRALIPWENIVLSGWCLASDKTKMSKSKGNIITPKKLIEEKGVDIIRYWAASSNLGVDTPYDETKFLDGKKLINKLKNVSNFISIALENSNFDDKNLENSSLIREDFDKLIMKNFQEVSKEYHLFFSNFQYSKAKNKIERFFFDEFCDYYLEIIKIRSYGKAAFIYKDKNLSKNEINIIENKQNSCVVTLLSIFRQILIFLSPFLIRTTNEILSDFNNICKIILTFNDENISIYNFYEIKNLVSFVRKEKTNKNLSINSQLKKIYINIKISESIKEDLKNLLNITENIEYSDKIEIIYI